MIDEHESTAPMAVDTAPLTSPYVGLRYYTQDDAELFFGRDVERQIIMGNLRASRLTLLYAQSGVGKSSLLRAGVAARLTELAENTFASGGAECFVPVVFSSWRDDPTAELIDQIERTANGLLGTDADLELPRDNLRAAIDAALGALDSAGGEDLWDEGPAVTLLVILDQFEEYFLYGTREARAGRFADELADCINSSELRANFLIAIREDAYSALGDLFKGHISNVYGNYLHLEHLDIKSARDAVTKPIDHYNEPPRAPEDQIAIEPGLVNTVLSQIGREAPDAADDSTALEDGQPAAPERMPRHVETAYLQLVMERLWEVTIDAGERELSIATLQTRLGGPRRIVRDHLERSLADLTEDEQATAAHAFRFMVTASKTKIARPARDLAEWTGDSEDEIVRVFEKLSSGDRGRILRPLPPVPGETSARYELFHDVLGEPIANWRKQHELEEKEREHLAAEHLRHQAKFNLVLRWAAGLLVVLLAAVVVLAVIAIKERSHNRSRALAEAALLRLPHDPELGLMLARDAWKASETDEADEALRRAISASRVRQVIRPGAPVWRAVPLAGGEKIATVSPHETRIWDAKTAQPATAPFSFRGEFRNVVADLDGRRMVIVTDKAAYVWTVGAAAPGEPLPLRGAPTAVAISGDGRYVAVGSQETSHQWLGVYNAGDGRRVTSFRREYAVGGLAFNPKQNTQLAVTDIEGRVWLMSWSSRHAALLHTQVSEWTNPSLPATYAEGAYAVVSFSPDGRRLATAVNTDVARVWRVDDRQPEDDLEAGGGMQIHDLTWSGDSSMIAVVANKSAVVFRADRSKSNRSGERTARTHWPFKFEASGSTDWIYSAAFNANDTQLVTAGQEGIARVYDTNSESQLIALSGHSDGVSNAAFLKTSGRVVTASDDGTARIWDVVTGKALLTDGGPTHSSDVLDATFDASGDRIVTAAANGDVRLWTVASGTSRQLELTDAEDYDNDIAQANAAAFAPDGSSVIVGGAGQNEGYQAGWVASFDVASGQPRRFLPQNYPVTDVEYAPDGDTVAISSYNGLALLSRDNGAEFISQSDKSKARTVPSLEGDRVMSAAFSPRGDAIAAAGLTTDGKAVAVIIDASSLKVTRRLEGHRGYVAGIAFSHDGRNVATTGADRTVRIWDASTGKQTRLLLGHTAAVKGVDFSPDGTRLVTAGEDATVRVWETATGKLLGVEAPHPDFVNSVQFSPDGRSVLSGGDDGMARLTECTTCQSTAELLRLAASRILRAPTEVERKQFWGD
jgi:WD40 repeat protein